MTTARFRRPRSALGTGFAGVLLGFVLVLGAAPYTPVSAIECGETLAGSFAAGQVSHYTFTAASDDVVAINVGKTGGSPLLYLAWSLFCPPGTQQLLTGETITGETRTDLQQCTEGRCQSPPLPGGTCEINVFDLNNGAGEFDITLEAVSESFGGASNGTETPVCEHGMEGTQPIHCGESLVREITPVGDMDTFTFLAAEGDVASITLGAAPPGSPAATGLPNPTWELYSPTGARLPLTGETVVGQTRTDLRACTEGQCQSPTLHAGVHTIKIFDVDNNSTFPYTITVEAVSASFGGASNGTATPTCERGLEGTQPLVCGQGLSRELIRGETDTFSFEASAGKQVRVQLSSPTAFANQTWEIFSPLGQRLPLVSPSGQQPPDLLKCSVGLCAPPALVAGVHTVKVFDAGHSHGFVYTVTLQCLGVCGDASLDFGEDCDAGPENGSPSSCCTATCHVRAAGETCRSAQGSCDAPETCGGTDAECPADVVYPAGTGCRPAAGLCDVGETCDGTSVLCPGDELEPSTTVCRVAAGVCDVAEHCTGASVTCPPDGFAPSSTVCRSAAGACDVAESCTGSSASCPPDGMIASGTVCRPALGACDVAETCTGTSATCPDDVQAPSATVCRSAAGACDVAETCTGSSKICPADVLRAAGTVCRPATGACDVAETCAGSEVACPADSTAPDGASCDDGLFCTVSDQCSAGACAGTPRVCDDGDPCTTDLCDEALDRCTASSSPCDDGNPCTADTCGPGTSCTHTPVPGGACDDGDLCTVGDVCQGDGTCGPGPAKSCTSLDDSCAHGICDARTGSCVKQPRDNPQCTDACVLVPDATVCAGCALQCGAGSCASGVEQCDLTIDVPAKGKRRVIIVIVVLGSPGERCRGALRELVFTGASVSPGEVARADDASGRLLGKAHARRIRSTGRTELKLKLNPVAKKVLREQGELRAQVDVAVGKGSSKQLLKQLLRLVRKS